MHEILLKVQAYLDKANREAAGMSSEVIEEAVSAFRDALNDHFNKEHRDEFKLYMSSIGRPLCQLQMSKQKADKEPHPYSFRMKMLMGDMIEIAAVAIMKAAGINIKDCQKRVELTAYHKEPVKVSGKIDVNIDGGLWDIKSCSPWVFQHKFSRGYEAVASSDGFGYVFQGKGYEMAEGLPFMGWIAIEKATGEWVICEAPSDKLPKQYEVMKEVNAKLKALNGEPFKRCFEDVEETYRKKLTGNKVLGFDCSMCEYKWSCWPGLQRKPQISSTAKEPKFVYYTYIQEDKDNDTSV